MTAPHSPNPPQDPFANLEFTDQRTFHSNRRQQYNDERLERQAAFEQNLEKIKAVPELVARIADNAAEIAHELMTETTTGDGETISPRMAPNMVYQTKHDFDHAVHHSGHTHPSGKRTLRYPMAGKPVNAKHSQGTAYADVYKGLIDGREAPRGWLLGVDSPISDFAMLGTHGEIYDVTDIRIAQDRVRGRDHGAGPRIGLGEHQNGSNLWKYLPSAKIAGAIAGKIPEAGDDQLLLSIGEQYFGRSLGPNWAFEADPSVLLNALPPNMRDLIADRLANLGSLDCVDDEIKHLTSIGEAIANLAVAPIGEVNGDFRNGDRSSEQSGKFTAPALQAPQPKSNDEKEQEKFQTVLSILPEIDSLELAIKNASTDPQSEKDYIANKSRLRRLEGALYQLGATRVPADAGRTIFDPRYHSAIALSADSIDSDDPRIIERVSKVFRSGFMLDNKLVRPTQVEVKKEFPQ